MYKYCDLFFDRLFMFVRVVKLSNLNLPLKFNLILWKKDDKWIKAGNSVTGPWLTPQGWWFNPPLPTNAVFSLVPPKFLFCNHIPEVVRVTVSALTLARRMRILSDLRGEGSEQPRTLSLRNGVFLLRQRSKDLLGPLGELLNLWELNTLQHLAWEYSVGASLGV